MDPPMKIGLRVDVDTFRGTRHGVPNLRRALSERSVKATFFCCVGPDNMGRHLYRLLRPSFLWKMLRTKAASLYGWDILLRGTIWPGPIIGEKLGDEIRTLADDGHEVGLHAWDHHAWQAHIDRMDQAAVRESVAKGFGLLTKILGRPPASSAAPAWKCNDLVLQAKSEFPFDYNSDCRGSGVFLPVVNGSEIPQPQVPVSLPTYDEVFGRAGVTDENYNEFILSRCEPDGYNVLTIHAEVEGLARLDLFRRFLSLAAEKGWSLVPLGSLVGERDTIERGRVIREEIPGRSGWGARQAPALQ